MGGFSSLATASSCWWSFLHQTIWLFEKSVIYAPEPSPRQSNYDDDNGDNDEDNDDERGFLLTPKASCAYFSSSSFTWLALGIIM